MRIDGVSVAKTTSYQFSTTGIHLVKFKDTTLGTRFFQISALIECYIPTNIATIGYRAFTECSNLAAVHIPETVTAVNGNGNIFTKCTSLTELKMPGLLETPTAHFYSGCTSLALIEWESITIVRGNEKFNFPSLKTVILGPDIAEFSGNTFYTSSGVETFVIKATTPPTPGNIFYRFTPPANFRILVPYSSDHSVLTTYQTTTYWSDWSQYMSELNPDGTIPTT